MKNNKTLFRFFTLVLFCLAFQICFSNNSLKVDSVAIYTKNNQYEKALLFAKNRSANFLNHKEYLKYSETNIQISEIYNLINEKEKALKVLFDVIKTLQKKEVVGKIITYRKIGAIYTSLTKYEKAKKYYYLALSNAKKSKNDSLIGRLNQPLYKIHKLLKSDSATYYLKKTMEYNKRIGDDGDLSTAYNNYFFHHVYRREFKIAKKYLDSTLYFAKKSKIKNKILIALTNDIYYKLEFENNFLASKKIYQEIFKLKGNDTLSSEAIQLYYGYAFVLKNLGDFKESNKYLDKYIQINSVLFDTKNNNAIRDVETKYQIEKLENGYKAKQILLEETQTKNQKIFFIIIGFLAFLSILIYFFYQISKLKQKNKLKTIQGQIQQNIINATLDGQELERKKIAGILHDNISAQLTSASLHLSAYSAINKMESEEISKTKIILKEAHDTVRDLSHELLPTLLDKFGLFYALNDLCEKNSNSLIHFEYSNTIDQKDRYNKEYETKVYYIVSELFNNILKHADASLVDLIIEEINNDLIIHIGDNGKGFYSNKSISSEGFGLTQIRARVSKMIGTFIISSKINSGTSLQLRLPIPE